MSNITPILNRVLVQLDARMAQSTGGIAIPTRSQKPEQWGEVVAVGNNVEQVQKGDVVFVPSHLGTSYVDEGREFVLIEEPKILARHTREGEALPA